MTKGISWLQTYHLQQVAGQDPMQEAQEQQPQQNLDLDPLTARLQQVPEEVFNKALPLAVPGAFVAEKTGVTTALDREEAMGALVPVLEFSRELGMRVSETVPVFWKMVQPGVHQHTDAAANDIAERVSEVAINGLLEGPM